MCQTLNGWKFFEGSFLADADVYEDLRITLKADDQFRESLIVIAHGSQQTYSRNHAIAGQAETRKNNMTRLFATHNRPGADQFLEHVLIADIRARKFDAT